MVLVLSGAPLPVMAVSGTIDPYVAAGAGHDDNIFRLPDAAAGGTAVIPDGRSDTWHNAEVGVKATSRWRRQAFDADLGINRNIYARHDFLDYTGGHAKLHGALVYGRRWSADVGYSYERRLSDYEFLQLPVQDLRTDQNAFTLFDRRLDPQWTARFGGEWDKSEFSSRSQINRRALTALAGIQYAPQRRTTFGFEGRYIDGKFPSRTQAQTDLLGNKYSEQRIAATIKFKPNRRNRAALGLGYVWHDINGVRGRNFNGVTGRANYTRGLTGKTSLKLSLRRDLSATDDRTADFAVITAAGLALDWQATAKLGASVSVDYQERDFDLHGNSGSAGAFGNRRDRLTKYGVALEWRPRRFLTVALHFETGNQNSTIPADEYSFNQVLGTVRFDVSAPPE